MLTLLSNDSAKMERDKTSSPRVMSESCNVREQISGVSFHLQGCVASGLQMGSFCEILDTLHSIPDVLVMMLIAPLPQGRLHYFDTKRCVDVICIAFHVMILVIQPIWTPFHQAKYTTRAGCQSFFHSGHGTKVRRAANSVHAWSALWTCKSFRTVLIEFESSWLSIIFSLWTWDQGTKSCELSACVVRFVDL